MSKGYIMASHSKSSSMDYYLRNGECLEKYHSKGNLTDSEIKEHWKQIVNNEKYGNKELGIRGRHDARISTNYTITLPNQLSPKENLERIKELIKDTPIEKCTYTIAIHKGEKDGVKNSHAHLIVNERNKETMKKDREMISKDWLKKEFQTKYEKTFEKEFSQGKTTIERERISTYAFQSNPELARTTISIFQMTKQNEQKQEIKEQPKLNQTDKDKMLEFMKAFNKVSEEKNQQKEQEKKQEINRNNYKGHSF